MRAALACLGSAIWTRRNVLMSCAACLTHVLVHGLWTHPVFCLPVVTFRADEGTEDEAALFGGTAGHGGRVGRCAVCVVQRKGKCGTDSAPRKCLRRQMLAQMHGEGGDVEGSDGEGVGRGGGPPEGSPPLGSRRGPANQYPGQFGR